MVKSRKTMPDDCSSTRCSPPQGYCSECSHAAFAGSAKINGKTWRWSFNPRFGPLFLKMDGMPMERQPTERNPVWKSFEVWLDKWIKKVEGARRDRRNNKI